MKFYFWDAPGTVALTFGLSALSGDSANDWDYFALTTYPGFLFSQVTGIPMLYL
jgi:hypothetical protein